MLDQILMELVPEETRAEAMTNIESSAPPTDKILTGVALMLGFCLTAPLLDVAAKLASSSVPVGQITACLLYTSDAADE